MKVRQMQRYGEFIQMKSAHISAPKAIAMPDCSVIF